MTLTHHEKLENLIRATEKLAKYCKIVVTFESRIYKIYSNSQTSIKIIKKNKINVELDTIKMCIERMRDDKTTKRDIEVILNF